jgi:hypothetical protein
MVDDAEIVEAYLSSFGEHNSNCIVGKVIAEELGPL